MSTPFLLLFGEEGEQCGDVGVLLLYGALLGGYGVGELGDDARLGTGLCAVIDTSHVAVIGGNIGDYLISEHWTFTKK